MLFKGTVGFSTKYFEPLRPNSSAEKAMKR
jgi:hypothetical protein